MATLQAARAYVLGLPLESALSWGLNRSIFYAAAKRGFKGGSGGEGKGARGKGTSKGAGTYFLGDEMAFKEEKGGRVRWKATKRQLIAKEPSLSVSPSAIHR